MKLHKLKTISLLGLLGFLLGCSESDRIVYEGYLYEGPEVHADYAMVTVRLHAKGTMNMEAGFIEYGAPYALGIYAGVLESRLHGQYVGKNVVVKSVKDIEVVSNQGELLYQNVGGETVKSGNYVDTWVSESYELNLAAEEVTVRFIHVVEADGFQIEEPVSVVMTRNYRQVWNSDLTGATP